MRIPYVLLSLLVVCSLQSARFEAWKEKFNKDYSDANQQAYRKSIFLPNCQKIDIQNALNLGYILEENFLSDRTSEEISNYLSVKVGNSIAYSQPPSPAPTNGRVGAGTLPSGMNWKSKTTPVRDQAHCGSCWVFSTTAHYETFLNIMGKGVYDLSQEYVLECTNRYNSSWNTQSNCNGGVVDYAMTMVRNVGIPNETTYPYVASQYTGSGFPSTVSSCFKSSNPNVGFSNPNGTLPTMKAYKNLTTTALKTLLQNGSAVGLIYADTGFLNYRSGVYSGCPDFSSSYSLINHAVEIVGYDANDNWIIKNSWSTNWGQSGYGVISNSADCALTSSVYQLTHESLLLLGSVLATLIVLIS